MRLLRAAWILSLVTATAHAVGPYPPNLCAAGRSGSLGCHANDVAIAEIRVVNGVTSCVAGQNVALQLQAVVSSNANERYDIGVFVARDGREPQITIPEGGSTDCAVYGLPFAPAPLGDFNGNACGDIQRGGTAVVDLGTVTVLCVPDQSGNLRLPTTITWQNNRNATCNAPPAAWVESPNPANCSASVGTNVSVDVLGSITITKRTAPAGAPGTFNFTATGPGIAPAAFALADTQSQTLQTGPLRSANQIYVITEQALAGFGPGAFIECTGADSGPAGFVTIDNANRRITARMNAANSRLQCTFTNRRAASIRLVKAASGGDATFNFTGDVAASITTVGGAGQVDLLNLAPGIYNVTEILPGGWRLTGLACADPSGGTTTNVASATARIDLAAGEQVVCTYTNARRQGIAIRKTTTGGDATFGYTGPSNFSLTTSGGASPVQLFALAPGLYNVTEIVPPGWDLASITCIDPTADTVTGATTATINLAAGEGVFCTFANTRRASIVVEKVAQGGDATFNFAGSAAFSITTASGSGSNTAAFASIPGGAPITITETVPAGWQLASAACRDAATSAPVGVNIANGVQVTPAAGQNVICTFTDTRLATLTIAETSLPQAAQVFTYTATGAGLANFVLTDDGVGPRTITFNNLAPGQAYSVVQAAAPGWNTPFIICTDRFATNPANRSAVDIITRTVIPNLQPGENLRCLFVNTQPQPGAIEVAKVTEGGDGPFDFANSGGVVASVDNPQTFTITTTAGSGARQLRNLAPGTYALTETVPASWQSPPAVQCEVTAGSNTTITPLATGASVALGQTGLSVDSARCVFTNTRHASLTIVEDAAPDGAQVFNYTATGAGLPAAFALVNTGAAPPADRQTFNGLGAGNYSVTSSTPAGWRLASITCIGTSGAAANLATGTVSIALLAGEDAVCTFRHELQSSITIAKSAPGASPADTFTFTGTPGLAGALANGQSRTAILEPGAHSVSEIVPIGWTLANIACVGGTVTYTGATVAPTNAFEPGDTTANIVTVAGNTVTCTFTNVPSASIVIVKNASGGNGAFAFTGAADFQLVTTGGTATDTTTFANLAPGAYVVQEIVPAGWRLAALTCSNASVVNLATATATVNVAAGERVTCTFANERLGRIRVTKRILGESVATFLFEALPAINGTGIFPMLPSLPGGVVTRTFDDVVPGAYTISENPPAGWRNTGIDCLDPTGDTTLAPPIIGAVVRVAPGETVECTWDNATFATITIGTVTFLGAGTAAYTATNFPTTTAFQQVTGAPATPATTAFGSLPPTTYTVTSTPDPAWVFVGIVCASDSRERRWSITGRTVTITIPDGENVRCFFLYVDAAALPGPGGPFGIPVLSPWLLALLAAMMGATGAWFSRRR